ncbi:hypothetical protein QWZ14_08905 [Paeniroseomonas aquatica]|uniref:Uncharacterized protein n=2 Tax=Paeniroseomonas aquatica TaxID=373043 RepID=A0ABT8A3X9_9PROT|nr:hypothetical protein [Paeniroseomonas aquatica]MDN3564480.1 hypothetical protein [Paeniroseomonas aquatica]
MELGYSPNGEAFVARYEPGDMVLLHRSEPGDLAQGQVGDWGKVVAVGAGGLLTIRIAGYALPKDAGLATLSDIPARRVRPCSPRGEALILPPRIPDGKLWGARIGRLPSR